MVDDVHGTTHPARCPGPIVWRGTYRNAEGKVFKVTSCDGHPDGITYARWARSAG